MPKFSRHIIFSVFTDLYQYAKIKACDILEYKLQELHGNTSQVWFADDATAASSCQQLRAWWDDLVMHGPSFGYFPKASKTFLVVKKEYTKVAERAFADTSVSITTHGKRHLHVGAAVCSEAFRNEFASRKLKSWCKEIVRLSQVALSHPHAAFAAYVHGQTSKWTYISRTIPGISHLLEPLEQDTQEKFIPAITGRPSCSKIERSLLELSARLGELGMTIPSSEADHSFEAAIAAMIALQGAKPVTANIETRATKSCVQKARPDNQCDEVEVIFNKLPPPQQRLMECTRERGASSWLSTLPIEEHGFFLHKGAFRDALCLRYGWKIHNLPLLCACGDPLSVDHAMCCHKGGFPTLRHNDIRDLCANLLREVCPNTGIAPGLQPLSNETFQLRTTNMDHDARVDIMVEGFSTPAQVAFLTFGFFTLARHRTR